MGFPVGTVTPGAALCVSRFAHYQILGKLGEAGMRPSLMLLWPRRARNSFPKRPQSPAMEAGWSHLPTAAQPVGLAGRFLRMDSPAPPLLRPVVRENCIRGSGRHLLQRILLVKSAENRLAPDDVPVCVVKTSFSIRINGMLPVEPGCVPRDHGNRQEISEGAGGSWDCHSH